jgi:hypothetical protein
MFYIILALGALTLICGIVLFVITRRVPVSAGEGEVDALGGSVASARNIFRLLLYVTAGAGVLQAIFGGLLYLGGARPGEGLHYVYGLIVLGAIPVAYVYSDQKQVRRDIIILTIAAVAIVGAAFRAFATGPGIGPH